MKTKLLIAFSLVFLISSVVFSQYKKSPGFAVTSAGPGYYKPLVKSGAETSLMKGFHFRTGIFELSQFKGQSNFTQGENTDSSYFAGMLNIGIVMPIGGVSYGKRLSGIKGLLIQPFAGFHYGTQHMLGMESRFVDLSPGISIQFPYVLIDARINLAYRWTKSSDSNKSFIKGLGISPAITLQFDGLSDIWNAEIIKTGDITTAQITDSYLGGGWVLRTTTWTTTDFYMSNVGPFFALQPYLEFGENIGNKRLSSFGINYSGRYSGVMMDIGLDYGGYKVKNLGGPDFKENSEETKDAVLGSVNGTAFLGKAGFDPLWLLQTIFFPGTKKHAEDNLTKNLRMYAGFSLGWIMAGDPEFVNPGLATSKINEFFTTHTEIERNESTDPAMTKTGLGFGAFFKIELASLSIFWQIQGGTFIGGRKTFGLAYTLPYNRIGKRYKELKKYNYE